MVAGSNPVIPTIFLHGADIVQKLKEFCPGFLKPSGAKLRHFLLKNLAWVMPGKVFSFADFELAVLQLIKSCFLDNLGYSIKIYPLPKNGLKLELPEI